MYISELRQPVNRLKGIGPNHHKSLTSLGIFSIGQLLSHYPQRYEDHQTIRTIIQGAGYQEANGVMTVVGRESFPWKGRPTLKVIVEDDSARGSLLCYGRNFLADKLPVDSEIYLYGLFQQRFGEWQCGAFEFEALTDCPEKFGKILPVYPLGGSLNQNVLRKAVNQALREYSPGLRDELPPDIREKYGFPNKLEALKAIHNPQNPDETEKARQALIYEELFHLQMAVGRNAVKARDSRIKTKARFKRDLESKLKGNLPFSLTEDQKTVMDEICRDMQSARTMNRLIQGDVGSGKTLMAFMAALNAIENGKQAALMAPTELLARQHAENAAKLLEPLNISIAYLTGNTQGEGRRHLLEELKSGNIQFVLGTHALFSDDVEYKNLGLAIIDEQHRFGVEQRKALSVKGSDMDLLYMTATPIPRTLTMTAFGDLDVSTIKTMPLGRKAIETHLAREGNEQKVYDFVRKELDAGRQAYFVYPLIEKSEKLKLKDAENMFEELQNIFSDKKLALIHSRIPEDDKKRHMESFSNGEIDILVATSVVEVGVDVPNATVMVIEHAERFGLSALHQLRGRVGRSELQSYAFLIYSNSLTDDGKQRLRVMMENTDGFIIAEEDLKLRGPGEIAGVKQSGYMNLKIADLIRDASILMKARADVLKLLQDDPLFEQSGHEILKDLWEKAPPFDESLVSTA